MRRPAHANPNASVMAAVVFEPNSKKALFEAIGADPANIAKAISEHPKITPMERPHIRSKVKKAMEAFQGHMIPNCTSMQLEIGSRRIRIKYN